ncbi:MAG: glycosyltransferase family 4 protein [Pseudomonadota bacterium]
MTETARPLRIAHLAFASLPATIGGLEIVVEALMREQRAAGHDVALVTRWRQAGARRRADLPGPVLALPPRRHDPASPPYRDVGARWPVAVAAMAHQLRRRFDVWHAHWVYPTAWMVHDALARLGVPMVITGHGADLQVEHATRYGFRQHAHHDQRVRDLVPRASSLTAVSPSIDAELRALGARPDRTQLILNGVEAGHIAAAAPNIQAIRTHLGVPPGATLILSVGRAEHRKGWQFVPETLARLVGGGADVVWALVGGGAETLRAQAAAHGVAKRMRFLPPVPGDGGTVFPGTALIDLYHAADVFAFPSLIEAFGIVLLEAMAAGTPVVANQVPGVCDVVSDGTDGLLCDPASPASMAEAIQRLIADPGLRARLSAAGRETAARHDWAEISRRYVAFYRETIARARA